MRHDKPLFSPLALIATLSVAAACCALAFWQLDRAEQKRQWLAQMEAQQQRPPVSLATLLVDNTPQHRPASITGTLDNAHPILLDNRMRDGVAGYYLLSPMKTANDQWVLLNRGWLARGRDRSQLPSVPAVTGPVTVEGQVYQPSDKAIVLTNTPLPDNQWPLRVQKVDFDAIGERLGVDLAPFEIRVAPEQRLDGQPALPRPWQNAVPRMGPDRHRAYALQWFALGAAAVLIFSISTWRRRQRRIASTTDDQ